MSSAFSNFIGTPHVVEAPAKLNLRLKLLGRRPNGYHLLSMLNTKISLSDELELCLDETGEIKLSASYPRSADEERLLSDPTKNIAARAFRIFMEKFKLPFGARMHIRKNVPIGSGLGGGSSDGASVLLLLERIMEPLVGPIPASVLREMALGLGSDVPFFLGDSFCHVGGTGETLQGLGSLKDDLPPMLLVVPPLKISTAEVYAECRARYPDLSGGEDLMAARFIAAGCVGKERAAQLLSLIENDLEPVAVKLYPELGRLLSALKRIPGLTCAMTGSGSGIFCIGENAVLGSITSSFIEDGTIVREIRAI